MNLAERYWRWRMHRLDRKYVDRPMPPEVLDEWIAYAMHLPVRS